MSGKFLKSASSGKTSRSDNIAKASSSVKGSVHIVESSPSPSAQRWDSAEQKIPTSGSSLHKIYRSADASLFRVESSPQACGMLGKILDECEDTTVCDPVMIKAPSGEFFTPSSLVAREIVEEMFRRATKSQPIRRMKKPSMKSGWMNLEKHINDFYISKYNFIIYVWLQKHNNDVIRKILRLN